MILGTLILKCYLNRDLFNLFLWVNIMKKNRKAEAQDNSQTAYTKILNSLRNAVSGDYSKVIQKEKRAVVLAYDWDCCPVSKTDVEATLASVIFHREEMPIGAVKKHLRERGIGTHWIVTVSEPPERLLPENLGGAFINNIPYTRQ